MSGLTCESKDSGMAGGSSSFRGGRRHFSSAALITTLNGRYEMKSKNIGGSQGQFALDFEPGLTDRYGSARDAVATGVYQRGLKRIAIELDMAPSNLSVQLSDDPSRHFSLDSAERYMEKTGDFTPIYFWVEKFLGDRRNGKQAALEQIEALGPQLVELLRKAGISA